MIVLNELKDRFFKNKRIKSIAFSLFWNVFGALVSKGSVFFISIFSARIVGLEDYGRLGMIQQTLGLFQMFAVMGLGITATKFVAENNMLGKKHHIHKTCKIITQLSIVSSIFFALVLITFSSYLSVYQLNDASLKNLLLGVSIAVVFSGINQTQTGILAGLQKFNWIARSNIIVSIITFPIMIALIYKFGVEGSVFGFIINSFLQLVVNRFYIKKSISFYSKSCTNLKINITDVKRILISGLPNFLAGLVVMPATWYSFSLLTKSESGYIELGALSAANQIFAVIYFIPIMLAQVVMPMIASEEKEGREILNLSIKLITVFAIPFLVIMMFFSNHIMALYGRDSAEYGNLLIVVLLTAGVLCIQTQIDHYIVAKGHSWLHFKLNLLFGLLFVSLSYVLLEYAALGIALARFIGYFIRFIILLSILKLKKY